MAGAAGSSTAPAAGRRRAVSPARAGVLVALLVLAVAGALAWLAAEVDDRSHQDLLQQQVEQAATVLTTQVTVLDTQLADAAEVAVATGGVPGPFQRLTARAAAGDDGEAGTGDDVSFSLWRVGAAEPELLAVQGPDPVMSAAGPEAPFLDTVPADGSLTVAGIVTDGARTVLGYALRPDRDSGLVVLAEGAIDPGRRIDVPDSGPFGGLEFAIHLGPTRDDERLIGATADVSDDEAATATVPLGDDVLTLVGSSTEPLTGTLSSALPWIVLAVGVALAAVGGRTVTALAGRRAVAEELAADNRRLYEQQRGIAGTLQHALLPDVPRLDGVEVAARYVAGVDELDVGGDWFDVVGRGPGCCVFVVGDVTGNGLAAATTMAELRFAVRAYLAQGDDIEAVATKLRRLLDVATGHTFATVLLGELDTATRQVRLVSAGHFAPLLVTGGRTSWLASAVSPPIGVDAVGPARAETFPLSAEGTLLAFTDGLVERRREDLDAGLDRLRAAAPGVTGLPLEAALDELMRGLGAADRGRDDTVLLGLRWQAAD